MKNRIKKKVLPLGTVFCKVLLTAWLFFDFAFVSLLLLLYVPVALILRKKELIRKKKWELNLAFKDALVCLENSLAVGYSPESSVRESVKNLEQLHGRDHDICREFRVMAKQMDLGTGMEEVFLEFGKRTDVEDIKQLADIFAVVKRTGGNLAQVLRQTGSVLQDKIELKRELRTTIAAKQMEFQIMCAVPYGILLYLKLCAPAMSNALYHNSFGILFMWGVLGAHFGLKLLGEKIIRGEVGKLEG
ncbi:MAG: type II secretion system F family protein [Lachnospiraceae bacterium]|nr:type II secretion system F family protein [Lachnospiraceae bacterium]MBQ8252643.1 type II secretion system F family protein [Lachnospiraceae bacterium]